MPISRTYATLQEQLNVTGQRSTHQDETHPICSTREFSVIVYETTLISYEWTQFDVLFNWKLTLSHTIVFVSLTFA